MFNGKRLKALRNEKNISLRKFAEIFNTTHATISRYENNINEPDSETISKIAEFFNVSTDYLLGTSDIPNQAQHVKDTISDDPELLEFWNELKDREDLQILFKQVKSLQDKDVKQLIRIIKAIEDEEDAND